MNPEINREHGAQELQVLRGKMLVWKESYLQSVPPEGGEDYLFLCQDFSMEIEEYVYPYVRRMVETQHIETSEASEFLDFCYQCVNELQEALTQRR
ncbi:MAG: hypothetical protein ABIG94_11250 [Pseudomonadota bacterium]